MYLFPNFCLKPEHPAGDYVTGVALEPLEVTGASAEFIGLFGAWYTHVLGLSRKLLGRTGQREQVGI